MFIENVKMAFVSLSKAKLRSFLTMLGIIIGVAAVVSIIAIGQGVKNSVTKQVAGLGSNVLTITSGQSPASGHGSFTSSLGASTLTQADILSLQQLSHVSSVSYFSLLSGIVAQSIVTANDAMVVATTPSYKDITDQKLAEGRFLSAADINAKVAVLGANVATELFGTTNPVGMTVTFRNVPLKVIGVIAAQTSGASLGGSQDAIVYLPTGTAQTITGQTPQIFRILAKIDTQKNVAGTVDTINATLQKNHGGQKDFSVLTQADLLSAFDTILNLLTSFIVAIASISLLVGGIGIMNIMLVSVTERTREIGLRKAIGAPSSTVLSQFLIEAIVISLVGGGLGILAAVGLSSAIGHAANISPQLTPGAIGLAVGVSAGVGIIFGIAPAVQAARKRPILALNSD